MKKRQAETIEYESIKVHRTHLTIMLLKIMQNQDAEGTDTDVLFLQDEDEIDINLLLFKTNEKQTQICCFSTSIAD